MYIYTLIKQKLRKFLKGIETCHVTYRWNIVHFSIGTSLFHRVKIILKIQKMLQSLLVLRYPLRRRRSVESRTPIENFFNF